MGEWNDCLNHRWAHAGMTDSITDEHMQEWLTQSQMSTCRKDWLNHRWAHAGIYSDRLQKESLTSRHTLHMNNPATMSRPWFTGLCPSVIHMKIIAEVVTRWRKSDVGNSIDTILNNINCGKKIAESINNKYLNNLNQSKTCDCNLFNCSNKTISYTLGQTMTILN